MYFLFELIKNKQNSKKGFQAFSTGYKRI